MTARVRDVRAHTLPVHAPERGDLGPFSALRPEDVSGPWSVDPVLSVDRDEGEVMTRVLIVEDDPVTARLLEEGLRDDGYDV